MRLILVNSDYPVEDVVAEHHRRNRGPRPPSRADLDVIRRNVLPTNDRTTPDPEFGSREGSPEEDDTLAMATPAPPSRQSSRGRGGRGRVRDGHGDDPSQLRYYPPVVRDILERAKAISRCDAASLNAYPSRGWYDTKGPEYVEEAISERARKTLSVPSGRYSILIYVFLLMNILRLVA